MKIAYFDCQFGAAGDMLNAALLAAGCDEAAWKAELAKVKIEEGSFQLLVTDVMRCNVVAKKLDVLDESGTKFDRLYEQAVGGGGHGRHEHGHRDHRHEHGHQDHRHEHRHEHGHHDHAHEHEQHDHQHDHLHEHGHREHAHEHGHREHAHEHGHREHAHEHGRREVHNRRLPDILNLIEQSGLRSGARSLATSIFIRLAEAESRVHGVRPEEIQFHEVGAIDSMVDIIGFSIAYDLLGIQKSFGSAVPLGSGLVRTEHGLFPIPGPATLYLLEASKAAIAESVIGFECLTPTGAAILCEVVSEWGRQPAMQQIEGVGYGAGTKDPLQWPNVCRAVVGNAVDTVSSTKPSQRFSAETLAVVEANLDDFNPQALAFVMEKLFEAGALDVSVAPVVMKKGRAGHLLTAICKPGDRVLIQEMILEQTSSIGVRWHAAERLVAGREWQDVQLAHGSVRIKIARDNRGEIVNMQPEFDDCARYAEDNHVPIKEVLVDALATFKRNASST